jgi:hypothetical protein
MASLARQLLRTAAPRTASALMSRVGARATLTTLARRSAVQTIARSSPTIVGAIGSVSYKV